MTATRAGFLAAHPEFSNAGTALIDAQLELAEADVSDSFGALRDKAVYLKLAHQLASSPWGRNARSTAPGAEQSATPYGLLFDAMARANALSASRLGSR